MSISLGLPGGSEGKESASKAGDLDSIPGSGSSPGEGNCYPVQYSCLGNPMHRGAWRATVHGVTKSWTQMSDWACTAITYICNSDRGTRCKMPEVEDTSVTMCLVAFCSLMCVCLGLCVLPNLLTHTWFEPCFYSVPLTELLFNKMVNNLESQMQVPRRGRKAVTTIR